MARDVLLGGTTHETEVGVDTYELWLKHATDAWALDSSGPVTEPNGGVQEFQLYALIEGDQYVAQLRMKRNGRYRAGYLTTNPDTWPGQSRVEFVPGALTGVGAPTINSVVWTRESGVATRITLSITPDDVLKGIRIFRDGLQIAEIDPGETAYIDLNPDLAQEYTYTCRHFAGGSAGPFSDPVQCWSGPLPPDVALASSPTAFGFYNVTWDSGVSDVDLEDDFLCSGTFTHVVGPIGPEFSPYTRQIEDHDEPEGDTQHAIFHARMRQYVEAFAVTDVSDWCDPVLVECDIEALNADFNSCP